MEMHARINLHRLLRIVVLLFIAATAPGAGQELPPEIQVDRLLLQAERESREGNFWSAASTLSLAIEVFETHELEIPAEFWLSHARALYGAGLHQDAVQSVTRYLQLVGREGDEYFAALELLDAADAAIREADALEARYRAEAERQQQETAEREAAIQSALPEMIAVHSFWRGSFEISKFEVTFAQWDVCSQYGPCPRVLDDEGWGRGDRPVINVSWYDAHTFVSWLSQETGDEYRLPHFDEWAHAALAGSENRYSWGRSLGNDRANCANCGSEWDNRQTAPVGSFAPNALGLHDVHGNVWEWVQNCYSNAGPFDPAPTGPLYAGSRYESTHCDGRMRLGGSFGSSPDLLRADRRWRDKYSNPGSAYRDLGFRAARQIAD